MCARQRGVSSELVALLAPVEPIFDRLPGLVISTDHFELGERDRQLKTLPVHLDEHLELAFLHGSHAGHLDLISYLQGGDGSPGSAPGEEREVELPFEVVVSTYGPFLLVVSIDDDLHDDPTLSGIVRLDLGSPKPLDHCEPLHPCEAFTPYHKYLRVDAQPAIRGHISRQAMVLDTAGASADSRQRSSLDRFPSLCHRRPGLSRL